ncbi:MAG TPA: O-antigen ligase family protein, partial [Chthoniobacteraceae bacterium]|nr:O-antigen ligase family protein [Chthoniobacteraceae bacterium]
HSILPVVPLVYFLFFWRQRMMKAGLILLIIPLYCIFLTESKGAFLCGFVTLLATLMFGRSRAWQIVILAIALGFGYGALYALPRMGELRHSKTDPAIQGRIAAFTYGIQLMRTHLFGVGLGNFEDSFLRYGPLQKKVTYRFLPGRRIGASTDQPAHELNAERRPVIRWEHYSKATHSAYNQNGAELGYVGLFLFVGILYCSLRTLVLMRCTDDDEERIRRALFATVVAYATSSWMVDFCYRPTFFMFVAAISAFHRHLLSKQAAENTVAEPPKPAIPGRPWIRRLPPVTVPGIALARLPEPMAPGMAAMPASAMAFAAAIEPGPRRGAMQGPAIRFPDNAARPGLQRRTFEEKVLKRFLWNRLGIMDIIIILILTWAAIQYWKHLIITM